MNKSLSIMLVLISTHTSKGLERKICKIPNGDAGSCIPLEQCAPLLDIMNNELRSEDEGTFLRQSVASCGSHGQHLKVCCAPESLWANFTATPVIYPSTNEVAPPIASSADAPSPGTVEDRVNQPNAIVSGNKQKENLQIENLQDCGIDASIERSTVGGESTNIDEYPWLALLEYGPGQFLCGGSLITNRFVLTAARCLSGEARSPQNVRLSEYNTTSYPNDTVAANAGGVDQIAVEVVPVEWARGHPDHDGHVNDIGLVKMLNRIKFTEFIRVICLPTRDYAEEFKADTSFTVAGWGGDEAPSEVKRDAIVSFVTLETCAVTENVTDGHICAGSRAGCRGDSGGPLMYDVGDAAVVVGVMTARRACDSRAPTVYVNVYRHLDWINVTMSA